MRCSPDHPVVAELGEPGEVFSPGLGVTDWRAYHATLERIRRVKAVMDSRRIVWITNRRLIVATPRRRWYRFTSIPLVDILGIDRREPEGMTPGSGETVIRIESRGPVAVRTDEWSTRTRDAEVFTRKLAALVKAQRHLVKGED